MHRFTDRDINSLKTELWTIITEIYVRGFDFTPYIESKVITWQERDILSKEVRSRYPNITTEPVPATLQPLIRLAREKLAKAKEAPVRWAPRYSYNWDYESDYDSNYRRSYRDDYEY